MQDGCISPIHVSQTCQHFDWRSRHKFQCLAEKQNSTQLAEVVNLKNSYEGEEDKADSSSHLRLELYTGNTNSRALILSQEVANNAQKEVEEQLRNLKEELAKIKNENISLRLHRDEWEVRARNSIDRLYSFRKENEHQVFILKHENELMSNAEKQARQMVKSLSQRLHCLQIAMESGVEQRRKQEHIHMLQSLDLKLGTLEKEIIIGEIRHHQSVVSPNPNDNPIKFVSLSLSFFEKPSLVATEHDDSQRKWAKFEDKDQ
ncbi:hypothetical protein VNO78_07388 [Psophocarpus tetragonolobus]|uniref:Uncharacterized protein n=1 Tax=Psophocarpus tetragonolobus TaxID=3891 RepID=A0AAN9SW47_PSOTE